MDLDGQERALKLYKGAITSDGKAEDEIFAISLLGQQSSLLSPEAIVKGHASGNIGILLPLIRTEEGINNSNANDSKASSNSPKASSNSPGINFLAFFIIPNKYIFFYYYCHTFRC